MNKNQKTNELNCRKHIANTVGADASVRPKNHSGITLIALVITIIVMLILVGVTVSVAINGGLFGMAKKAKSQTEEARDIEQELANGRILVGDTWYDSMSDYVNGNRSEDQSEGGTYFTAEKEDGYLTENATYKSGEYTATIPKGFKVSEIAGEDKIETGLVIKDKNGNEFVWIPVAEDLKNPYNNSAYIEPIELTDTYDGSGAAYDSQETLNYLYEEKYYNYEEDFKYEEEYEEMVNQVNKYDGFYIGRYETTIDGESIGSKVNTEVLTPSKKLVSKDGENYYKYRWYGFYYALKNANIAGNHVNVQTAMIYGQLWDKTMDFINKQKQAGKTNYNVDKVTESWHQGKEYGIKNSGQANAADVVLNIWDLESNGYEWTQEANSTNCRVIRGGGFDMKSCSSSRHPYTPNCDSAHDCSRLILYIKD